MYYIFVLLTPYTHSVNINNTDVILIPNKISNTSNPSALGPSSVDRYSESLPYREELHVSVLSRIQNRSAFLLYALNIVFNITQYHTFSMTVRVIFV